MVTEYFSVIVTSITFLVLIIRTMNRVESFFKEFARSTAISLENLENGLTKFVQATEQRLQALEKN